MEHAKEEVRKFMEERNWLGQPLSDVSKSIVIEAAELLEHFQWNNYFNEEVEKDPEMKKEIIHELADVFIYALEMAILLGVNVGDIVHEKLELASRKYPVGVVNGKLGSKKYKEIKEAHRKKS